MKKLTRVLTFCFLSIISYAQNNYIAQPYYGDNMIRFYVKTTGVLHHSLDIGPDGGSGPNCVRIFGDLIFISTDAGASSKVLIYHHADIYPTRTANAPQIINYPSGIAGMEVDGAGNLYVSTFNGGGNPGRIIKYNASSNYTTSTTMPLYDNDWWINYYAGVTVDGAGNVWALNLDEHELVCFTAASSYNSYYVVTNNGDIYPSTSRTGGANPTVYLFSGPEGIQFDASGNLWIANNNDWTKTNNWGEGTFVKLDAVYIATLLGSPVSGSGTAGQTISYTVPTSNATVYHIPGSKPGGIRFDGNTLFINDQGTNQGSTWNVNGEVWKWDVTTAFNAVNAVSSAIHTTYPGYGGMDFNNFALFPLPIEMTSFSVKKIGQTVNIQWVTASEINCSHFELQRSIDGINYENIYKINATNTQTKNSYQFNDDNLPKQADMAYYRIKQIDNDGTEAISAVRTIGIDRKNLVFISPNPTQSDATSLTIDNDTNEEFTMIRIYSAQGHLEKTLKYPLHFGVNKLKISTFDLVKNMHIINIIIGNATINTKLLVN